MKSIPLRTCMGCNEKKPKKDGVQWHADAKDFRSFSIIVQKSVWKDGNINSRVFLPVEHKRIE